MLADIVLYIAVNLSSAIVLRMEKAFITGSERNGGGVIVFEEQEKTNQNTSF